MKETFDWRAADRRLYLAVAIIFTLAVFIGFGPTYYFKPVIGGRAVPSTLVHCHGLIMSAWVIFFVSQVMLIRTKNAKTHMKLGMIGIALAILIVVVGFFTGAGAAKNGSASAPPDIPPLAFFVVPFFDLIIFVGLFAAAIYYRTRPAHHKRLMLLTALNFLPPAIARIQIPQLQALGPLYFFGVPSVLAIGLIAYDTWRNKKVNYPFVIGSLILIASYPLRLVISGTDAWINFATWVTTWAA